MPKASASRTSRVFLKKFPRAFTTQQCTSKRFFISFVKDMWSLFSTFTKSELG